VLTIHRDRTPEGCVVCSPAGELEAFTVAEFRQALADLCPCDRLIIDMSRVTFVDSAGLGALIGGIRRARELGGRVAVACNRPALLKLLHTTGFDRIVPVEETVQHAAGILTEDRDTTAQAV
jgi:anti-sigma B factor antagonist